MNPQEYITNKIINPIKSMGKSFSSYKPKDSTAAVVCGSLISAIPIITSVLLSYIPSKASIIVDRFAAYAQQQQVASDPLSESLQIAQSKVVIMQMSQQQQPVTL